MLFIGDFYYYARTHPSGADVTLQPGESWYVRAPTSIWGDDNSLHTTVYITSVPSNVSLYPIIVNGNNLSKYLKGITFEHLCYFDKNLNATNVNDSNISVNGEWSARVIFSSSSPYLPGDPNWDVTGGVNLVIKNGGPAEVHIDYKPDFY